MSEGSEYDRLFYPFLFEGGQSSAEEVLALLRHSTLEKCRETVALRQATLDAHRDDIVAAGRVVAASLATGGTVFALGNGGSTTDAEDLVADLLDPPRDAWRSRSALALTAEIAVITAVANDVGFDNIFSRQLIAFGRAGDVAVGISTSGNSRNVLAALEQAKRQGLHTIALAGYDGGRMALSEAVDIAIVSPGDHVPRIQEAQATVYHAIIEVAQTILSDGSDDDEVR